MRRNLQNNKYGNEFIMVVNSTMCLISAFIFAKLLIGLVRYFTINYFGGEIEIVNFDVNCITRDQVFWTTKRILIIYSVGVMTSSLLIFGSLYSFNKFKYMRGLTKLWFLWLYVVSVVLTLGTISKDIMLRRDFYWTVVYMYIPRNVNFFIVFLSSVGLLVVGYFFYRKFLRFSISLDLVKTRRQRMELYTVVAVIPIIISTYILVFMHFYHIRIYEITEALILIIAVFVPYLRVYRDNKPINLLKNERTNIFSKKALFLAIGSFILFYIINFLVA
jgi:hypothetical protein